MRVNYAIVFVSDMAKSVSFYHDAIGLPLRFESPEWAEFATDGATVALHKADAPRSAISPPHTSFAGTCRPGFRVTDLDEFHKKMLTNGVTCAQEPKNIFGTRVAQYLDPDGLVISIGEERVPGNKGR